MDTKDTLEIKHPTHVGATQDREGGKRRYPVYLEKSASGTWVEFRRSPGEWTVDTGILVHPYKGAWDYQLVDVREVTTQDLVAYWSADHVEAQRNCRDAAKALAVARRQLARAEETVELCERWVVWSAAHLESVGGSVP